jgi:hypothetical protein
MNQGTRLAIMKSALSLLFFTIAHFDAKAGAPISFIGYKNPSTPIFSKAGPTVINYQLYDEYTGIHKPGGGMNEEGFVSIIIRDSKSNVLYQYFVTPDSGAFGSDLSFGVPFRVATGSFRFANPFDQNMIIEEQIFYTKPLDGIAGFASQEWSSASGQSLASGGDRPLPGTPAPAPSSTPGSTTSSNIHALIISGRSDPAKIVTSPNVTLIGGVVALGKNASSPAKPSSWSPGLRIVPDQNLLTGSKIPPLTPNVIDVRIVKHEVVGDLSVPSASPSP